jgi:hypothetical protein
MPSQDPIVTFMSLGSSKIPSIERGVRLKLDDGQA